MSASNFVSNIRKNHHGFINAIAKLGYISRGAVYLIIGFFAALTITGQGESKGSKDALSSLLDQPMGAVLLWIVAIGLVCYSLWRLIQSLLNTDDHSADTKGFLVRAGLFVSSVTHLSLAWWAISLALGNNGGGSGQSWSAKLSSTTGGSIGIIIIAACIMGAGLAHIYKGATCGFLKRFKDTPSKTVQMICQVGLITKGLAFLIVSYLFILTIVNSKAKKNFGVEDALDFTASLSFGWLILSAMGFGLIAFGCYSMIEAKYRKISLSS